MGLLWSIVFIEGVRVIVLENWRFDIFWPPHWAYAWSLWQSGWVIDTPKEWAFILILLTFIPLWLTGWIALSLIPWECLIYNIISLPFKLIRRTFRPIAQAVSTPPVVVKRKSYKEVRPSGRRLPISDYKAPVNVSAPASAALSAPSVTASAASTRREMPVTDPLSHAVFNLDDEDDNFDLDIDSFEQSDIFKIDSEKNKKSKRSDDFENSIQPARHTDRHISEDIFDDENDDLDDYEPAPRVRREQNRRIEKFDDDDEFYEAPKPRRKTEKQTRSDRRDNRREKSAGASGGTIGDVLANKGYDVMRNISVRGALLDYVAVCEDRILICMIDKEPGDWLADEERFNDEEPLWFSESNHRISPVRVVLNARDALASMLTGTAKGLEIKAMVVIRQGTIINAEDMFEIWNGLNITVCRYEEGGPDEITPLQSAVSQVAPPDEELYQKISGFTG